MRVRYTSSALSDLVEILTYLSGKSPVAADAVLNRIDKVVSTLSSFPYIGQEIDEADVIAGAISLSALLSDEAGRN